MRPDVTLHEIVVVIWGVSKLMLPEVTLREIVVLIWVFTK